MMEQRMDQTAALHCIRHKLEAASQRTFRSLCEEFKALNLKSDRVARCTCLIADWLTLELDGWWARVNSCWIDVVAPGNINAGYDPMVQIPVPSWLRQIVNMFDSGALPEFDRHPVPNVALADITDRAALFHIEMDKVLA